MLEGLFDEEAGGLQSKPGAGEERGSRVPRPPAPRSSSGLCGLSNLGATCYLNSLLQTLHFTPEFREALFSLDDSELGIQPEDTVGANKSQHMVREIPVELQKLFVRLLLSDQQSAEVNALTNSFGWKSNEEFQQHDVQELNRILFGAIESSLLGTSGERLIANLYHGTSVQQIKCQCCGTVSEREEEFQDIPVALSSRAGLEDALKDSYIEAETLDGANQYHCSNCNKLVDAKRECHLRKLPQILTFALLRFLYDFNIGERYKDTSKFKFPVKLDMSPYCEAGVELVQGCQEYELFSVVVHSGSTHSGHYTAIIRDVDALGSWTHPSEEVIQLPSAPSSGKVDLIDYDNPADLIKALLEQLGGSASINKICKALQEQTGVTWNKRFKKQFGPINKFVKSCTDLFSFNEMNHVSLVTTANTPPTTTSADISTMDDETPPSSSSYSPGNRQATPTDDEPIGDSHRTLPNQIEASSEVEGTDTEVTVDTSGDSLLLGELMVGEEMIEESGGGRGRGEEGGGGGGKDGGDEEKMVKETRKPPIAKSSPPPPPPGHCWFEFNDTHVGPALEQSIEKMFQGKQSAYMLFYRRASLTRPPEARGNPLYGVPERLQLEVTAANARLEEERLQYDIAINTVRLHVHHSSQYFHANGALQSFPGAEPTVLSIDRRKTVAELKVAIFEAVSSDAIVVHTAKVLPAGMHLYECISDNDDRSIADAGITNDSNLFVWDGAQVAGETVHVGVSCEPVLLHVTYPAPSSSSSRSSNNSGSGTAAEDCEYELISGFPKNSTLKELRVALCDVLGVDPGGRVTISQVKMTEGHSRRESTVIILGANKDKLTLEELQFNDGERLAAEREVKKGVKTLAHSVADKQSKVLSLLIEDHCSPQLDPGSAHPVLPVEVPKDELISSLKALVLSKLGMKNEVVCRLRVSEDLAGMGPPLYEDQTLLEADIARGATLILEPGPVPLRSQLALQCTVSSEGSVSTTGEVVEVILDRGITVSECCAAMAMATGLTGDEWHLRKTNWCGEAADILDDESSTLEQAKLKSGDLLLIEEGKLPPKGYIQLSAFLYSPDSSSTKSETHQEDSKTNEVPLHLVSPSSFYPPIGGDLLELGRLLISKDSTVEDLKLMILTLPVLEGACVPAPSFLRVRELVEGRPAKVFKQSGHSLRRHKLTSDSKVCCSVLPQEEALPTTAVVFNVHVRVPGERRYEPFGEVIFDTATSTSPHALRAHIAGLIDTPEDRLRLAKHKLETFEWLRIQDSYESSSRKGKKKGRGGGKTKVNIKNSPILLRDGDTIGVKDIQYDPEDLDDFSTPEDDRGKAVLAAIQEEKRKRRKAKGDGDILSGGGGGGTRPKQRRPEVGIKIFVPDYRSNISS